MVADKGVTVLNNQVTAITVKNYSFYLSGFRDMVYSDDVMRYNLLKKDLSELYNKIPDKDLFQVLLFHRSNDAQYAAAQGYDLILSGHTHGGQIGIPFLRDYILKKWYMTTEFVNGYYRLGKSQIVVSTGLESTMKRPRFMNPPQLVIVTLKSM